MKKSIFLIFIALMTAIGCQAQEAAKKRFNSDFKISGTAHTSGIKGVF